jgi:DNA excision repair protein ERCC-6-like 2
MVDIFCVVYSAYRVIDGEKIVWSEAEEAALQTTKRRFQKRPTATAPPPPKRRKKISSTTGVGIRRRVTAPARPRSLALNLGTPSPHLQIRPVYWLLGEEAGSQVDLPSRRPDLKPYTPPEPIAFSDLESDNTTERPDFDTTPSAPKQDLQLSSGGVIPASIAQWLRNYQVEGVEFMYRLWKSGRGGILGDDMGLGSIPSQSRELC